MTMSRGGVRPPPVCADCSAPDPTWASVNRGVLICDECCSVHRSLGRHISIVKSLKKGQWSPSQHAMVYLLATSGANNIWEHTMLDPSQNRHGRKKPGPRDPLHPSKSDFIRAKYQFLSFINKQKDSEASSLDDVSKELHSSVRTNNVETCLRLLSKGADPNYFYREKGNCPMHVAAQAGQTAQIELLAVYGADPGVRDANGRTPVDYARNEGFTDLAHRLVELQYELTDRLTFYICGRKPDHRAGQHFKIPQLGDHTADLSDLAKQAKKKLQDLPNHLFEELAMDVYDEVDRRENDSIWLSTHDHTSIVSERLTVPHLPVNPELSTTRNQGRQKLARFNAREFATLVMDILNDARLRQTGIIQTPKEPDKFGGLKLLKRPQSKTISALSDEEPLYDSVASDEDYSSIDSQSIRSMQIELKEDLVTEVTERPNTPTSVISFAEGVCVGDVEGPVTAEEFLHIRRALAESQARIQHLVQVNTDLEKHLSDMQSKMESLMMENQTLRIHRDSMMADHVTSGLNNGQALHSETPEHARPQMRPQARPTSMIEMRDASRQLAQSSPGSSGQLSGASSVSNISMTATGQEQVSSDLEDQLNANVLEVIDDLPDAILSEAYDPPKSVASQVYEPPKAVVSQGFHPIRAAAYEPPKAAAPLGYDPPKSVAPHGYDPASHQAYNPPRGIVPQGPELDPSKAVSQGYELPMSVIPPGYEPPKSVIPPGYEPPKSVIPPGYEPPKSVIPPGYEPPKSVIPPGYEPVKAAVSQAYNPPRGTLPQGYEPPKPVSQAYEPPMSVVPPGYDPAKASMSSLGYNPSMAISTQGHGPAKALYSQCYDPSGVILSHGYDPPKTVTSQGYDPARGLAPQGYDPQRMPVSHGYEPPKAPANQAVSQTYDPLRVPVSQGYDGQRATVPPGYDPQNGIMAQGQDPQRPVVCQGYSLPKAGIPPPGFEQSQPAVSQGHDPAGAAVSQGYDTSKAPISQGHDPAKVVSQGNDLSQTVVSSSHDPANAHVSQPGARPEVVGTHNDELPATTSMSHSPDLPHAPPPIPLAFDPPPPATTATTTTTTLSPSFHSAPESTGFPAGFDPSSTVVPPPPPPQGFEPPPAVIALGYDTPNVVLSQGCDVPSAVISPGYEAPNAVLPQGYEATSVSVSQAASVSAPQSSSTNGVPPGHSAPVPAGAGAAVPAVAACVGEHPGQEAPSTSGRESSETDDQDSTCSQPVVGVVGALPSQGEVVRKTETVTKKIQELLQTAQEGNHNSFAPCSERIHVAVTDMAALFPDSCPTPRVQETLEQLTTSAQRLREECKDWPPPPDQEPQPDFRLKTQQVIQFAFDIAKAVKKLVTLLQ
ncbi:uncharacterized protein LOC143274645 [Babylonia areolata]|uniref:uncharacterized protein LOC143274645 n=1 Tax=Babylonia areolata TaxID=304850 RepID=UPI003FD1583C